MSYPKLDVLAFAAHPDDAELACSGTLLRMKAAGAKTGVCDLTRGELGTRGTAELRMQESAASARILGLDVRENLGMADGFFQDDEAHQRRVVKMIRKYRPEIVLCNAPEDRHPDHGRGGDLVEHAAFLSGLRKIETQDEDGTAQEAWRPRLLLRYVQDRFLRPDIVVDISDHFETKLKAIAAFSSQFHDPDSAEPETYISSRMFWEFLDGRAREFGHFVGVKYGEGFVSRNPIRIDDLRGLL